MLKLPEVPEPPRNGLLRLPQVLRILPISASSWWAGIVAGRYPAGRLLSPRVRVWPAPEIWDIVEGRKP